MLLYGPPATRVSVDVLHHVSHVLLRSRFTACALFNNLCAKHHAAAQKGCDLTGYYTGAVIKRTTEKRKKKEGRVAKNQRPLKFNILLFNFRRPNGSHDASRVGTGTRMP